ncbi:MFS transporter [Nonomuraea soli]|uniref:MFS family permease n=1 Tax=Nonomuraea soli TaxID=1032476 RepID=A0A7W0CSM2_9ACTN|nr:MFS transporter [Nonomuraea soli]MBA2896586.1 MFS family permease [Nonomuraea soli]
MAAEPTAEKGAGLGRAFHVLWASTSLTNLADGVLLVGVPLLAVSLSADPLPVALVSVATTLPWLLLSLHAGAIADRADRRRIVAAAGWTRAAVLAGAATAAWFGWLSLPLLIAAVLLAGIAEVFADTAAQSVLPMTVASDRLPAANGRLTATQTLGNHFAGAPLAGLLVGLSASAVFGAAALLYLLGALVLIAMSGRFRVEPGAARTTLTGDIGAGLRFLWRHRALRSLTAFTGLVNLSNGAYFAVFVLWVAGPGSAVGLTPQAYGLLAATLAVGAVAGSVLASALGGLLGQIRTLVLITLLNGVLLLVPLLAPVTWAVFAAAAGLGLANAVTNVIAVSRRQSLIPEELLGRVNAACRLVGSGAMPVGAALAGVVGAVAGVPVVFWTAAALCLAGAAAVTRGG